LDGDVREALRGVIDPELGENIVELGMVRDVTVDGDAVDVHVALTTARCPLRSQLRDDVIRAATVVPGVTSVTVHMAEMTGEERSALMARARWSAREDDSGLNLASRTRILAVSSGKGGVGKSSVSVNLAVALAGRGLQVGILDADIWGFSVPRMLGVGGRLEAEGTREEWRIVPARRPVAEGSLEVVSMGLLAEGEGDAIMWRGLLLNRALRHFVENVRWGDLDYLVVDMPPGTGDIQMGLARMLPRAEVVVVTTPAVAAQKVAARAADMARKGYLRVVGVVENMASFTCDHGQTYPLFGGGGGERLAREIGAPLLASIPLDPAVAAGGDEGVPPVLGQKGAAAEAFDGLAQFVAEKIAPVVEMGTCTARLMRAVEIS
jgi:ATP-binding protein involved in chromosome partitioning